MKPEEFLRAMGEIDPDYIEEAEEVRHKKKDYKTIIGFAACFGLMVAAGSMIRNSGRSGSTGSSMMTGPSNHVIKEQPDSVDGKAETETKDQYPLRALPAPKTIYVDDDCYELTEESISYEKESLICIGTIGEEGERIHADGKFVGGKVYRIDPVRIMVEIDGKDYTYKK